MGRMGAAALCIVLGAVSLAPAQNEPTPDAVLAEGIALVQQGDFEAAILKLDDASRRLAADPSRNPRPAAAGVTRPLADAYLYLGISYLELNQELNARAKFREVLKVEPNRRLSDRVFSPQIIRVFEAARVEMFPNEKKQRSVLPLLLIAGGGAASAGVAVATSGGDSATTTLPATTVPTTTPGAGGGNPTTTTTTTLPGATTTLPASTTLPPSTSSTTATTLPGSTTTTTTTTTTSTTSSTTTTTTLPCTFTLSPPSTQFTTLGGNGTCDVVTQPTCSWTATKTGDQGASWLNFTGATSGTGNGSIGYGVALLSLGTRTAQIQVGTSECIVVQTLILRPAEEAFAAALAWQSTLEVPGGRGQVVIDGTSVRYQDQGLDQAPLAPGTGTRQVVAQLVASKGPGSWTFRLPGSARPGSLRPLAGAVSALAADSVTFRLVGKPGERIVFTFDSMP